MKNNKLSFSLFCSLIAIIPFVAADIKTGPRMLGIPIEGLIIVVAFIIGAIFLIRWIIKKNKKK